MNNGYLKSYPGGLENTPRVIRTNNL